jgi:hypothetical protein
MRVRHATSLVFVAALVACVRTGETGDALVTFNAYASGPADANGGNACGTFTPAPLTFPGAHGFTITLTQATMTIGAVYLVEGQYNGGSSNTSCFENGTYCGQVPGAVGPGFSPLGLDLLCPDQTEFSVHGNGSADLAGVGEVWLTGGLHSCLGAGSASCSATGPDINATADPTPIVELVGSATNGKVTYSFRATVTIQQANRGLTSMPGLPGDNPICKQRIVEVFPLDLQLSQGGNLYLTIDPRGWFNEVDFTQPTCATGSSTTCAGLQQISGQGASAIYEFPDSNSSTIGLQLFTGIQTGTLPSGQSAYQFGFTSTPPSP